MKIFRKQKANPILFRGSEFVLIDATSITFLYTDRPLDLEILQRQVPHGTILRIAPIKTQEFSDKLWLDTYEKASFEIFDLEERNKKSYLYLASQEREICVGMALEEIKPEQLLTHPLELIREYFKNILKED